MKRHLHLIALGLFFIALFADLVMWGAVPALPNAGVAIERSARNEAFLASTYIAIGSRLDAAVPMLGNAGVAMMTNALSPTFERMGEDPSVAMDLILKSSGNRAHFWLKFAYWGAPILFVMTLVLWARKPKTISLIRQR